MVDTDTRTNDDTVDATADTPSGLATERLIERFGGIRPMAAKLDIPVTTVQGWKKRGNIPAARHPDILAAAERHGIALDIIDVAATEPAGSDAAAPEMADIPSVPARPLLRAGTWVGLAIGPLATLAVLLTFGGLYIVKQKTADLSHRVNELSEQNSKLENRLTRLESLELAAPAAAVAAAAADAQTRTANSATESVEIATLSQKLQDMQASNGNHEAMDQTIGGLQQTVSALQTSVQTLSQAMDATKAKIGEMDTVLAEHKSENAQQFAILLSLDQLRIAAATSQPFDSELNAARTLARKDPDVLKALDALSPYAADGVPTLNELRAEFSDQASEIVRSNVVGDGHSWSRQALYRLSQVIAVRKVSLSPSDKETPEHAVARAESKLEEDDLAGAVAALKPLTGLPQEVAASWIEPAQNRLTVDAALANLSEICVARLEAFPSTSGGKP